MAQVSAMHLAIDESAVRRLKINGTEISYRLLFKRIAGCYLDGHFEQLFD
jgi:hypothetical protein